MGLFLLGYTLSFAQENYDISTLRIGPFTIFMKSTEAEKFSKSKLVNYNGPNEYNKANKVNYNGEMVEITVGEMYQQENDPKDTLRIYNLSTKSKKFRTKSGVGVGSTRDELIDAYRNYPNFSVSQGYDDNGPSKIESYFRLTDNDAATELSFKMIGNTVVEVMIYQNEGC